MTGRSRALYALIGLLWVAVILALIGLGTWQVQRRAWKLDLIERVNARLKAAPVASPATAGPDDAYRRVTAIGRYVPGHDSFVQASTVRGPGWWVMTPLRTATGTILVNRGYIPDRRSSAVAPGTVKITGLLRLTEPGGGFLRHNDPVADRWYSRDVAAIAARRGILKPAPYFIDADATGNAAGGPVGGLTVIHFPNSHLVYAITWYALALMTAVGFRYWLMLARRRSSGSAG